jgi:uncharacterized protein YjbI with pentapeptide repeats
LFVFFVFFFKQKTAYEMWYGDWSSDVCSSDLAGADFNRSLMNFSNLRDSNLRGASFFRAKLAGADLTGADVAGADFTEADLDGTIFRNTKGFDQIKGLDTAANRDKIVR